MTAQPPLPERTLPPRTAARIRADVMAATVLPAARPRTRGRTLAVAAALVVLLTGIGFALSTRVDHALVAAPAPVDTSGDRVVTTDLGPLTEAQTRATLAGCARPGDPALRSVLAARRLSDGRSPFRWVLYRNVDDQVVLCSRRVTGPTYGGVRGHLPSDRYPVVALGGDVSAAWLPERGVAEPTTATDYATAQFFAAAPEVATVQLRVVVDGVPGVWFSGDVQAGFVLVPVFEAGPVPLDREGTPRVAVERRAFDRDGRPVSIR